MIRFIMIGGFLGAGKTTTIGRLAKTYQERGQTVGIVTNDQASDLVDTNTLRSQGFEVGEVAGACFCCNFNELTETVAQLEKSQQPDVVLAEPVGSCTDLVATVVQPLVRLYGEQFDVAPYGVILKPSHGRRILSGQRQAGFSPKAEYIFKKQLEEADFLIINRIDELAENEIEQLHELLNDAAPHATILRQSATTGAGFEALLEMLEQRGAFGQRILDIDYDIYAEGEAELGWLNSSLHVRSDAQFALDNLLLSITSRLQQSLAEEQAETAHLKTIGLCDGAYAVANLVSSDSAADLSLPSHAETKSADLVINARVAIDPQALERLVDAAVREVCAAMNIAVDFRQTQSFRPGRPVPTHRYSSAE